MYGDGGCGRTSDGYSRWGRGGSSSMGVGKGRSVFRMRLLG